MSPKQPGRSQPCDGENALARLAQARKFLELAELAEGDEQNPESNSVAAANAVLAGIDAPDAACCKTLGRRSRGQDHRQALELLEQVEPGGVAAAVALGRLLDLKDAAQYGLVHVSGQKLKVALRQARALVDFAEDRLR